MKSILHVVFKVAGAEYALPAEQVLQLESYSGATQVPGTPPYVAGIIQVRGQVVPVIDLRARFGHPPGEPTIDTRVVVTQIGRRTVGLRVDSGREVIKLDPGELQSTPQIIAEQSQGFVKALAQIGPRLIMLVDLPKILGEELLHDATLGLCDDTHGHRALPG